MAVQDIATVGPLAVGDLVRCIDVNDDSSLINEVAEGWIDTRRHQSYLRLRAA